MHLLSYFKSLTRSIANQGHDIILSLHKHSHFPLRRKIEVSVKATWLLTYNQVIYFLKKNGTDKKG